MEQTDNRWGGRNWMKDGERINHRTLMHDPGTQTTIWGLTERGERREALSGGGKREEKQEQL